VSLAPAKDSENISQHTQGLEGQGLEGFGGGGGSSSAAESHRWLTLISDTRAHPDPRDGLVTPPEPISSVLLPDLRETLPDLNQLPAAARASFGRERAQSGGPRDSADRGGDKVVVTINISGPERIVRPPVATGSPIRPSLSEPQSDLSLHVAARPPEYHPPPQRDAAPSLAVDAQEVPDLALRALFAYDHDPPTSSAIPSARMYEADPSLVEMVFERPVADELRGSRIPHEGMQASGREPDSAESV
jgi:hypothetical protein